MPTAHPGRGKPADVRSPSVIRIGCSVPSAIQALMVSVQMRWRYAMRCRRSGPARLPYRGPSAFLQIRVSPSASG